MKSHKLLSCSFYKKLMKIFWLFIFLTFLLYSCSEEKKIVENNVNNENKEIDIQLKSTSETDNLMTTDEIEIREIFERYIEGSKNCDIDGAYELISEASKEIVHFTCQNYLAETKCYENQSMAVRTKENIWVIYRTPFSHMVENPVFFIKENGIWKIAFNKMAFGMAMSGSSCDSGWNWINEKLPKEFCSHFPEWECPDGNK